MGAETRAMWALNFARRHKKKLIFTGAVAATGYYAYKTYLAPLVEDPMVKEVMKQMASPDPRTAHEAKLERQSQLEEYETQLSENADKSAVGALTKLQELVVTAVGTKKLDNFRAQVEAKSKKESVKLWNEMVNLTFTQATVAMYAVSLQEFLRRLQMYILDAYRVRQQLAKTMAGGDDMAQLMSMMSGQSAPANSTTTEAGGDVLITDGAEFLMMSAVSTGYFAKQGLQKLVEKVKLAVKQVLTESKISISGALAEDELFQLVQSIRKRVEEDAGLVALLREYFVSPDSDAQDSNEFDAQLRDVIDQHEDLPEVLEVKLATATKMLQESLHEKVFSKKPKQPLAQVAGVGMRKAHHVLFQDSAIKTLNSSQEVSQFFAMIYTSLEAAH